MRLPYAPSTPSPSAPSSEKSIYDAISQRRAPRPLQKLDLALLHSPPIASGWNAFLGAIRSQSILPQASVQEVAICRVAVLNRAAYEWDAHSVLAGAGGRLREVMQRLGSEGREGGLSARQWAVVAFADQSTREVQVSDEVWKLVKEEFSDREMVELTATVAAYNCVSRFLAALDVGERNGGEMEVPKEAK
ncbi:AhpD-like protein [Elsinoe ampelina]|uniref:AhpD-like protein n=1 Tax=Elsinoe ampelina TaxID=302913 RepID=A0A6A6G0T3_9PEZI|nr:AhpD-like protein [Elsinoe ampelina]